MNDNKKKNGQVKYFLTAILCMTAIACHTGSTRVQTAIKTGPVKGNIFHDGVLRQIYTLQNQRDAEDLVNYLKDKNPAYRRAAALAFASVQSAGAVNPLAELLADDYETVRSAAAYALGQVKDKAGVPFLIKAYDTEQAPAVRRDILEALGKCGTEEGLAFICELKIPDREPLLLEGQAWGLYRSLLRDTLSPHGTALAVQMLDADMPEKARFIAANYLMRAVRHNLVDYHKQLLQAYESEKNLYTRMALVTAMGLAKHPAVLEHLQSILMSKEDPDYRLKVNAVRALGRFDYSSVKEILLEMTADNNVNVAAAASEYFPDSGQEADAHRYYETARQLTNWRPRTNMLTAALKYTANPDEKKKISRGIIDAYRKSVNNYEKAYLLKALAGDVDNYRFVESETFAGPGKETVLSTYGMDALVTMGQAVKEDKEKLAVFAGIFKRAIESGDSAMVGLAAGILREPGMNFKTVYNDTGFLKKALDNCRLPGDIEAWQELKKTLDFFTGSTGETGETNELPVDNQPIDWELATSIPPDQRIRIKTSRGDITLRLMVNEAPGSAANFVKLIKEGFYKKSVFHRVAPNFVIQDGCPRGDGWGGPMFTIGSEFGPLYYQEGSVGMASAGKDTEGSQWFITHSPTPHLDGRYTIFAQVVSGMETVHRIEIGDRVLGFDIL